MTARKKPATIASRVTAPEESVWPRVDFDDYSALSRERGVLLGRITAIEERMREITGRDTPCWTPGRADPPEPRVQADRSTRDTRR
jgi:hypothetical protein